MSRLTKNKTRLTADHMRRTETRFVFEPQDIDEAAFIVKELQGMGFQYYSSEYEQQLENALKGCLYLDTDNTIMVVKSKQEDGLLCAVEDFESFYFSVNSIDIESRLTDQGIATSKLAFFPRTSREARAIYSALEKKGARPEVPEKNLTALIAMTLMQGMIVEKGVIRFVSGKEDLIGAEICTAADVGFNGATTLSTEQITIMAAFNEMAARMEQMTARIARLEDEVLPQKIEKKKPAAPAISRTGLQPKKPGG